MLDLRLDLVEVMGFLAKGKTLEETKEHFDLPSIRAVKDRVKQFEKELGHQVFNLRKPSECFVWAPASEAAREALLDVYALAEHIRFAKHLCKAFGKPVERTRPSGYARTPHLDEVLGLIESDAEKTARKMKSWGREVKACGIKRHLYIVEDYFGARLLQFWKYPGYLPTDVMRKGVHRVFVDICCLCGSLEGVFSDA